MADTRPTLISIARALFLCVKLLVAPEQMADEEKSDNEYREKMGPATVPKHRAYAVRKAFFSSLLLVVFSGLLGYAAGALGDYVGRCAPTSTVAWLQITGAMVLLWGTLFIRGWEIQTLSGVSLTERINQWIYRTLCCVGTVLLVYSLAFPACRQ
jgi:hypothetical protein